MRAQRFGERGLRIRNRISTYDGASMGSPQHSYGPIIESFNYGQISARECPRANRKAVGAFCELSYCDPVKALWVQHRPGFIEPCLPTVSRIVPTHVLGRSRMFQMLAV
jgi:hypothetical protein